MATYARLMGSQLPSIVGLSQDEIRTLIEFGVFPPAQGCRGWNAKKIRAWAWGLKNSVKLASRVEFVLGYRRDGWASDQKLDATHDIGQYSCIETDEGELRRQET
jgi:hypothetical protein